jgi:hypothetical protein
VNGAKYPVHLLIGNIVVHTKSHLLARRVAEIAKVEIAEGRTSGMVNVEGLPIAWKAIPPSKQKGRL